MPRMDSFCRCMLLPRSCRSGKFQKAALFELKEAGVLPRYETPIYSLLASQRNYFYLSGMDLFEAHISDANSPDNGYENQPLATRMRPATLDECVGQEHLIGEGKILHRMITRSEERRVGKAGSL